MRRYAAAAAGGCRGGALTRADMQGRVIEPPGRVAQCWYRSAVHGWAGADADVYGAVPSVSRASVSGLKEGYWS